MLSCSDVPSTNWMSWGCENSPIHIHVQPSHFFYILDGAGASKSVIWHCWKWPVLGGGCNHLWQPDITFYIAPLLQLLPRLQMTASPSDGQSLSFTVPMARPAPTPDSPSPTIPGFTTETIFGARKGRRVTLSIRRRDLWSRTTAENQVPHV